MSGELPVHHVHQCRGIDVAAADDKGGHAARIDHAALERRHADESAAESRADRKAGEYALLRELMTSFPRREDRIRAWVEQTGKSERAFYRRLAEMQ